MQLIGRLVKLSLPFVFLALTSCTSGGGETPPPAVSQSGTVTLTGTVSGTVIKVLRVDNNTVTSQTDTAPLTNPPFPFSLSNIPVGVPVKAFFFSAGEIFPLYLGNTNVFTVLTAGSIDLGFVDMGGGRATPTSQLPPNAIQLETEDQSPPPQNEVPRPATLTVTAPAQASGSVIVSFTVQNFSIGGQGQPHLHIMVDDGPTHHFFNGQTKNVLDGNGQPTPDVRRQTGTSFRLDGLTTGPHSVTVRLATASDNEFVNQAANPAAVTITITDSPLPPATLNIINPAQGASLPSGPVDVSFAVQGFTIGGSGAPHLHIYLDGGTANHFLNGTINQVIDGNGRPLSNITWQSSSSFQITGLSGGPHVIRLRLADDLDQDLLNGEAQPPDLDFSIQAPPGSATLTITSPAQDAQLPPGPVLVTFDIQNSPVTTSSQPRMHFYVDSDPIAYKFYDGPGITEEGSTSGVRKNGFHTHYAHWKSGSSIQLNALPSGSHTIRFILVDQAETTLAGSEKTLSFTILQGQSGVFSLQEVVGGLNFAVTMATAPDGRIFVNELSGTIRVVTPTPTLPWSLQPTPFATLPVVTGNEKGLLGIAVDPQFTTNGFVYVFYTAAGPVNRVVRFTAIRSGGNTVASGPPITIFDNIPAANDHNGGVIGFGPDGMLYVFVGENDWRPDAQSMSTLRGKILRINPNGSIPADNPFTNTLTAPFTAIWSLGHRNSFGFTFHPHTNDLWQTENGEYSNDEINRIVRGGNYGWATVEGIAKTPPFIDPILTFTPTIAPTGIVAIREDSVYPAQFHNNLFFSDFNNGDIHQIVLGGPGLANRVSDSVVCSCNEGGGFLALLHGLNIPGQDGYVYATNGLRIFRLVLN